MEDKKEIKIVYIEDEKDSMLMVKRIVEFNGYTFIGIPTGLEGIKAVEREIPNIVLCDITLPDIDGFQIIKTLKNSPVLKSIPVIAITAKFGPEDTSLLNSSGFDDCIFKPFEYHQLVTKLNKFLNK